MYTSAFNRFLFGTYQQHFLGKTNGSQQQKDTFFGTLGSSSISLSYRWETGLAPGPRAGSWQNWGDTSPISQGVPQRAEEVGRCRDGAPRGPGRCVLMANALRVYDCHTTGDLRVSAEWVSLPLERLQSSVLDGSHELFVGFLPAWLVLTRGRG